MFKDENQYTLSMRIIEGVTHYYVSFIDGQAVFQITEVSRLVFLEFIQFIKVERSLRHWDERHREYSELTDETLNRRAIYPPKSLENTVFDKLRHENLVLAIQQLPEKQRRRFVLYYEFGLTYRQIADMEGHNLSSIYESIQWAEKKIKEKIKKFELCG